MNVKNSYGDVQLNVWNIQEQLLKSRVVKCYGEVNERMAYEVTSCLDVMSNDDPSAPIKLEINTPGGDILQGLAICNKIKEIPNPVIGICLGEVMSMGTVICASCDFAISGSDTRFMIHEASSGTQGKFRDQKTSLEFTEDLNKVVFGIIGKKTGKTYDELMNDTQRDLFMNPKQALEYKLIDGIMKDAEKASLDTTKDYVKGLCSVTTLDK